MGELSPWHLAIIALLLFVLFGYRKLPDATRSLGRSMRIFKSEIKGLHDDEPKQVEPKPVVTDAQPVPAPEPVQASQPVQTNQPVQTPQQGAAAEPARPVAEVPSRSEDRA